MNLGNLFRYRRRPRPPRPQTIISRQIGKAIAGLILAGGAAIFGLNVNKNKASTKNNVPVVEATTVATTDQNYQILKAISENREMPFVEIKNAKVIKLLRNDNKGARHQRWIIQLQNGTTVTVSHNIDLAEKVPLSVGDTVDIAGELVFGDRKGDPIMHWTHSDPQKKHMDGYIMLNGKKYGELIN